MVTGGMDGQVAIHDTLPAFQQSRPPQPIRVRLSFTVVNQVAVSPDGTRLAAAYNGGLYVLDGITGNKLLTLKGHRGRQTASVAFSPDGQRLASGGGDDKTIKVWDTTTGRETLTLRGHMDYVSYVAFSADGKRLVSASCNTGRHRHAQDAWLANQTEFTLRQRGGGTPVLKSREALRPRWAW